jgi:cyclic pyranopterin phosphate synthase
VRVACTLACPFCFSRSSISALAHEPAPLPDSAIRAYYADARARGATRLVITGGGEPLLRPAEVLRLVRLGREQFDEVACFTNGARLTPTLAGQLTDAGLSYLCWSRHHFDDAANRALMGAGAPDMAAFFAASRGLRVRATCVMTQGAVHDRATAGRYLDAVRAFGVEEVTFKHTYVAYTGSVFQGAAQDVWARAHRVADDPFAGVGEVTGTLPWGPVIRRIGEVKLCFYHEPTPDWELGSGIGRSTNLLSDGTVYGSLEDRSSRLYRLPSSPPPSRGTTSSPSGRSSPSATTPGWTPTAPPPRP